MLKLKTLFFLCIILFVSCGPAAAKRTTKKNEPSIVKESPEPEDKYSSVNYQSQNVDKYAKFLVKLEDYTTNGSYYHEKHQAYLVGLAEILTEKHTYAIKERSIGFYYDKVKKEKDKLYLGLDVICSQKKIVSGENYYRTGQRMIGSYIAPVLGVVRKYEDILSEKEVEGVVVGLFWFRAGRSEFINVWFLTQNIREFYNDRLTFNELIVKSTVTNTDGKEIRLTPDGNLEEKPQLEQTIQ